MKKAEAKDALIRIFLVEIKQALREGFRLSVVSEEEDRLSVLMAHPNRKGTSYKGQRKTIQLRYDNGITRESVGVMNATVKRTDGKLFTALFANNDKNEFWNVFVPDYPKY